MKVMTLHKWYDHDIEYCDMGGREDKREIGIRQGTSALILSKGDVVALAKEFCLVVYEKGTEL